MIKIFPAETSLGSSNPGTEKAPGVILKNSLEAGLKHNLLEYEIQTAVKTSSTRNKSDWPHNYSQLLKFGQELYQNIINNSQLSDVALTLGGDHWVSVASLFASKLRFEDAVVVYVDAHPDCTSPIHSLTGNAHGMQLATVMGDSLYEDFEYPKYDYKEVFMVGIKDIDPAEVEYLQANHILNISMDEIIASGIDSALSRITKHIGGRPVHISVDIDSVDETEAPATGIINKGGLSYREISYLCRYLAKQNVVAIDMVEVNPDRDKDNKTTKLASELIINLLGGQWSPYTQYIQSKN